MDYVSQKSLRAFILSYLFAAAQTDKAGRSIDEIKSIIVKTIGLRRVEIGIEELEGDELVEDISPTSAYEYALTAEGYIHAEKSYLNEKSQSFKNIADRVLDIQIGKASCRYRVCTSV